MKYVVKVFLEHLAFGLTIPFSVVWMLERGLPLAQAGLVQSVVFMATFLFELPTGLVADKFGRKASIVAGMALHALGLFLFSLSSGFVLFLVSAVCTGVAWALLSGAEETYLHDVLAPATEKSYKTLFARVTMTDELSTMLGMALGALVVLLAGVQAIFHLAWMLMMLAVAYMVLFLPRDHTTVDLEEVNDQNPQDLMELLRSSRPLVPTLIALGVLFESARLLWQPALLAQGLPVAQLGLVFAGVKLCSVLGTWAAEKSRIPHAVAVAVSGVVGGAALLGLSSPFAVFGLLGLAGYFFAENMLRVHQSAYLLSIAPYHRRKATFISGASLVRNLCSSVMSPLLGWGAGGSLAATLGVLLVLKAGAGVLLLKQSSRHK